mmetsp:Transcript_9851/g.36736  ORF Transcript_9851/g.36736 Transcript_9851/m.36736 type:complete len:375 (+) Transcript_9851:2967-4091(+)
MTISQKSKTSSQSVDKLDRILGCLYGNALGDAVGLCTEFMKSTHAKQTFQNYGIIPFPAKEKTSHSIRWANCDWTDDTDQMILLLESFMEGEQFTKAEPRIFARKLRDWIDKGFPELGDCGGLGIGQTVYAVVEMTWKDGFLGDPHKAAIQVWENSRRNAAANGALMRTAVTGIVAHDDMQRVLENSEAFARVTHADSRCIASVFAVTSIIANILQGKHMSDDGTPIVERLLAEAKDIALKAIDDEHKKEFEEYFDITKLEDMKLDETGKIGYTLKCMSAALYGLRNQTDSVKQIMTDVTLEAGDADTNLAVCGALIGVSRGLNALPKEWLSKFPHKKWLDEKVVAFAVKLGFSEDEVSKRLESIVVQNSQNGQ